MLTNGKIYTVDSKQPWAEAIAVKGNEIVFVGSSENAGKFVGDNTRVADLEGRMVLPGMIDSHLHAILGAIAGSGVWVAEIPDIDGVLAAISEYANAHPEKAVIFGWGYGLTLFGPEGPSRELLDKAESDRPVYIIRGDGHSAWANTKALALAGVDKNTLTRLRRRVFSAGTPMEIRPVLSTAALPMSGCWIIYLAPFCPSPSRMRPPRCSMPSPRRASQRYSIQARSLRRTPHFRRWWIWIKP